MLKVKFPRGPGHIVKPVVLGRLQPVVTHKPECAFKPRPVTSRSQSVSELLYMQRVYAQPAASRQKHAAAQYDTRQVDAV